MVQKTFFTIFILITTLVLVACSSSLNFQSEAQAPDDSGVPVPDIFGTEETQPHTSTNNQSFINLLILMAFGLVSLILLVMLGRR